MSQNGQSSSGRFVATINPGLEVIVDGRVHSLAVCSRRIVNGYIVRRLPPVRERHLVERVRSLQVGLTIDVLQPMYPYANQSLFVAPRLLDFVLSPGT